MFHGLSNQFLYSAFKITSAFMKAGSPSVTICGTAFFIHNKNSEICLVTNRHMVDLQYPRPKAEYVGFALNRLTIRGRRGGEGKDLPREFTDFAIASNAKFLFSKIPENDIVCLIKPPIEPADPALTVIDYFLPHAIAASDKDFETKLSVCDFVAFPGYPPWHDRLNERPILRTGALASDPRSDYAVAGSYSGQCVAYEAFSFGGSSGSPIFAVQKGPKPGYAIDFPGFRELLLIGINAGHLPTDSGHHSGISYMYKSSAILDIIDAQ